MHSSRAKTGTRKIHQSSVGNVGVLAVVVLLFLGGASLLFANVTMRLQNERAKLRTAIDERAKELNTASIRVAEREDVAYIAEQADMIGLVPTERVSFYQATGEHLTRR